MTTPRMYYYVIVWRKEEGESEREKKGIFTLQELILAATMGSMDYLWQPKLILFKMYLAKYYVCLVCFLVSILLHYQLFQ